MLVARSTFPNGLPFKLFGILCNLPNLFTGTPMKNWTRLLCIAITFWLLATGYEASPQSIRFDHLTLAEGLSQSTVLAITQDAQGFMWFGTREGLNRYDARNIKVFRNDPRDPNSLSDNFVYCLMSDSRGRLWVGTRTGLNLFDPQTGGFRKFFADAATPGSLSDNTVTCIIEDQNANIWIGTRRGFNLLVEDDSLSFTSFIHDPGDKNSLMNDVVHSIYQDNDGVIWIGTNHGFSKFTYAHATDYSFSSFHLLDSNGQHIKNNSVNTFSEDNHGRLLVGTERNGVLFLDKRKLKFLRPRIAHEELESKAIRAILKDPEGKFWIGTIGGLYIANKDFSRVTAYRTVHDNPASISDNSIRSLFCDRDGSFWIGTFHGGVNFHSPLAKQFRHITPDFPNQKLKFKIASAITTDHEGNFWIGTDGNGLLFLDPQANLKMHFKHEESDANSLCHDNVKSLLVEKDKGVWIGTINGLDYYDFNKRQLSHLKTGADGDQFLPDDVIYDLIKDRKGKMWVATYFGGLVKVDPIQKVVEDVYTHEPANERSLSARGVTRLFIDSKQNLWVGTTSGLNKKIGDEFLRFLSHPADTNSLSGDYIVSIFEDRRNRMWIGSRDAGLNLLSADGKVIRRFSREEGLPGNTVYAIQEDARGYLWLSTENGLSRLDTETFSFRNFNSNDGLLCTQFNFNSHHRDDEGYLYFGGYNGVDYFHPDSIQENTIVPELAFTEVRLFNKEIVAGGPHRVMDSHVSQAEKLVFRHEQNIFTIEFSVLNYINARKNSFAYRLEGFEDDWNFTKEPIATYMNLQAGTYTLLVKGSNNDGIWNDTPKRLLIEVLPAPWKTWWAYTGYLSIFLLLLYAWARLNKKQVRLEHDLQLEHMEKVKQEEFHQAKLNFFTNIAHEIRTPLTLIATPIGHLLDNHSLNAKLKKELILVKNNSDRLMRLLNQLLDFQKQETGNVILKVRKGSIVAFVREIIDSFQEYADARNVSINFGAADPSAIIWFDRDELSKVFFNLLQNALKFTPGGGHINISVSGTQETADIETRKRTFVKVVIEDNGLGIPTAQLEKIFHRFYQAEHTGVQDAGFGIGLALAKGIIDLHHGHISVESREATSTDCGFTRFTILLPSGNIHYHKDEIVPDAEKDLLAAVIDDLANGHNHEEIVEGVDRGEKPMVLLVEDHEDIRRYIRGMLTSHYHVLESRNGSEGLSIAVERLPDLIISDIMMPVMNGIDLVCKLKRDDRTNHIPVILLTARATLNHQVEGLETGADDYLTKPFNMNLLMAKIKNHLAIREKLKEKYSRTVSLQPTNEVLQDPDERFLQRLMRIMEDNLENSDFNVSRLVKEIGMSRPVLFRKTKMLTGLSVIDLIRNVRLKKAEMLLRQRKLSISEVAFTVGFSDPKYFSKSFRSQYGKSPSQYVEELK